MSLTSTQTILLGLAGLATAVGVASATIQSRSPKSPNPPIAASPASRENRISPVSPNDGASGQPQPVPAKTSRSASDLSAPASVKTPTREAAVIAGVSSKPKVQPMVVTPPNSGCKITQAVVNDPNPPLNVRLYPRVADSKIVGTLKNNSFVSVAEEQNGWLRITDPVSGWIAKNRTESSCANLKHQINFMPGGDEAIIKGKIIGGGSHSYRIRAEAGQTITVRNRKDVFPQILTPDGKLLTGNSYQENLTEWTGKIPVTGNYTLQLDSNFRGYEYEIWVQLR